MDKSRYVLADWQPDKQIKDPEVQKSYYYVDTGLIAQNVYLFAALPGHDSLITHKLHPFFLTGNDAVFKTTNNTRINQ